MMLNGIESSEGKTIVRHYDYTDGNGKPMRMTVKGVHRPQYDVDLFVQALTMLVEQKRREQKGLPPEEDETTIIRHE